MPRNPNKTHCSVPGCKAWAVRDSDPPLCAPHTPGRVCPEPSRRTCPEPSRRIGAPPDNRNALVHGFYASSLHPDDLEGLDERALDGTLDGEILLIRLALRRLQRMLANGVTPGPDPRSLDPADYARFFGLTIQAANALSRLLRVRNDLRGNPWHDAINHALDELGERWGYPLV